METTKRIFDALSGKYRDLIIMPDTSYYVTQSGEPVFRIETKGRTGKVMYRNLFYIVDGRELRVHGCDGATGHGWGGQICGYLTRKEIDSYGTIR
jgi:hypothetical protein